MAKHAKHPYENNPFTIGLNGIKLLFSHAQSVAIFAIILCVMGFLANLASNIIDIVTSPEFSSYTGQSASRLPATSMPWQAPIYGDSASQAPINAATMAVVAIIIGTIIFGVIVLNIWIFGAFRYTSAQLAADKQVALKEALVESGRHLAGYLWLNIIAFTKILLWSLLFIIPGFIMAIRYSLAGTIFFAEGKKGNAAIKRSLELTKGAWLTTYAAKGIWNLITFGQIDTILQPGADALLYRQLRDVTDANQAKPSAHWLSWLTLFLPIALFVIIFGFIVLMAFILIASGASPQ